MSTVTTAVSVTFSLNSLTDAAPPYEVTGCSGAVTTQASGTPPPPPVLTNFTGFGAESIGTPQPSGATFSLSVTDLSYNATTRATSIGNWALMFIPCQGTTQLSPFGNNASSAMITGSGGTVSGQTFSLPIPNSVKIQQLGNNITTAGWDWVLMVQMIIPTTNPTGTVVHCFASDPEWDVSS
jgi:hypothetical protein